MKGRYILSPEQKKRKADYQRKVDAALTPEQRTLRKLRRNNRRIYLTPEQKERERERRRNWCRDNKDRKLELNRRYLHKNKYARDKAIERAKIWRANNPEKARAKAIRSNRRFASTPHGKIRRTLSVRLCEIVRSNGAIKSQPTLALLGCDLDWLKAWLEVQFQPAMTWQNYGYYGWHIDHIRPCASFDLTDSEQQKCCFHWTNLQPLWATENWRKNDKWNSEFAA